jgi:hypothetical protein
VLQFQFECARLTSRSDLPRLLSSETLTGDGLLIGDSLQLPYCLRHAHYASAVTEFSQEKVSPYMFLRNYVSWDLRLPVSSFELSSVAILAREEALEGLHNAAGPRRNDEY